MAGKDSRFYRIGRLCNQVVWKLSGCAILNTALKVCSLSTWVDTESPQITWDKAPFTVQAVCHTVTGFLRRQNRLQGCLVSSEIWCSIQTTSGAVRSYRCWAKWPCPSNYFPRFVCDLVTQWPITQSAATKSVRNTGSTSPRNVPFRITNKRPWLNRKSICIQFVQFGCLPQRGATVAEW